jgi:hypothetical protein
MRATQRDSGMGPLVWDTDTLMPAKLAQIGRFCQSSASGVDVEDLLCQPVSHGHEHRPIQRQGLEQQRCGRHQMGLWVSWMMGRAV